MKLNDANIERTAWAGDDLLARRVDIVLASPAFRHRERRRLDAIDYEHWESRSRQLRTQAFRGALQGLSKALVNFAGAAGALVSRWNAERQTRRSLEGLSDHILHDIGVRREQIAIFSRELVRKTDLSMQTRRVPPRARAASTAELDRAA